MSTFYSRLMELSRCRERGLDKNKVIVSRDDLIQLLENFERLDNEARERHASNESQSFLASILLSGGKVRRDGEAKFFGKEHPSRGFYITDEGGRWYLHHDGLVKDGVRAKSEMPAFWTTEKEAQDFFDNWKSGLV